jgi:UDP-3-O-[3-hydroxymyristoyl] glucosamine N-acyltransferase
LFFRSSKYYTKALNSAATVILINKKVDCPEGKALLISEDPFNDFNRLTNHFKPFESAGFISTSAVIGGGLIQPNVLLEIKWWWKMFLMHFYDNHNRK